MTREQPGGEQPRADGQGLVDLIDRLEKLLNDSDLVELEVEAGQTGLLLRKASAIADATSAPAGSAASASTVAGSQAVAPAAPTEPEAPQFRGHVITAPLTGLYYTAPSPGAEPYVREGGQVSAGQVIGLIEAMKLFNEIKSDVSGRVLRIHAETGALVKAKQPLIEVET